MENRKNLIKKFRAEVCGGKHTGRTTLLAYAFLREVPYVAVERVINEDGPLFNESGRNSFLSGLAYLITMAICQAQFSGKTSYSFKKEGNEEKVKEYNEFQSSLKVDVNNWIQKKYKTESQQEIA